MACIDLPLPTLPTLAGGLGLGGPLNLAIPPGSVDFCCKILAFPAVPIPIPLPALALNAGVIATLNAAIAALNAYHDALSFDCPAE